MIPVGARNIRVEEVAAANNFLALQNDKGEYYLNGHWFIQWSGDYKIAGTTVHYERAGNMESVTAQGPLKEPLHVMVGTLPFYVSLFCTVNLFHSGQFNVLMGESFQD